MDRIGIINIGSNVIRLMLAEIEDDGYFSIIDDLHSSLTFCYDNQNKHPLSDESLARIVEIIKSFNQLCNASETTKVILTATDFFRYSENKDKLISTIKEHLDLDVNVLTTEEEIRLTTLGVTKTMKANNSLLVYVGRFFTQIVYIHENKLKKHHTLSLGSLDVSYKFNLNDRVLAMDLITAIKYINDALLDIPWLNKFSYDSIIIAGELSRNLYKIDMLKKRYPLPIEHYYKFESSEIHDMYNVLKAKNHQQRSKIDGLDINYSNFIVGGATILHSIIALTNCDNILVSSTGLREGVLYDYILKNYNIIDDNLNYSISGILNRLNINKTHAAHVCKLSHVLFRGLKPIHNIDDEYVKILKTASLLHDSGISINYENHHLNSFYIIMNSMLNNLNHREILMSAGAAASHRFNSYKMSCTRFSSIINRLDLHIIEVFGVILKISEGLDRSLSSAVEIDSINYDSENVEIIVTSNKNIDLEISQALRAESSFYDVFHKNLIIKQK